MISWRAVLRSFSQELVGKILILFLSSCPGSSVAQSIACVWFYLLVGLHYKDFQKAGNNCGLLHSCGRMCATEPDLTIFLALSQLKNINLRKFCQISELKASPNFRAIW